MPRNEAAPALARTRIPSWATRCKLTKPALKFVLATSASMLIHGQLVVLLRDHAGVPFVVAKMIADIGVFSVGQLLLLRYLVFPKAKPPATQVDIEVETTPELGKLASES